MSYTRRICIAAFASILLHTVVLAAVNMRPLQRGPGPRPGDEPLVVRFEQPAPEPEPEPVRRLVDVDQPAEEPPEPTDLISDKPSKAADTEDARGAVPGPVFEQPAEHDVLARPPAAERNTAPRPAPSTAQPEKASRPVWEPVPAPEPEARPETAVEQPPPPEEETEPEKERFEVARAEPPTPPTPPERSRGQPPRR